MLPKTAEETLEFVGEIDSQMCFPNSDIAGVLAQQAEGETGILRRAFWRAAGARFCGRKTSLSLQNRPGH